MWVWLDYSGIVIIRKMHVKYQRGAKTINYIPCRQTRFIHWIRASQINLMVPRPGQPMPLLTLISCAVWTVPVYVLRGSLSSEDGVIIQNMDPTFLGAFLGIILWYETRSKDWTMRFCGITYCWINPFLERHHPGWMSDACQIQWELTWPGVAFQSFIHKFGLYSAIQSAMTKTICRQGNIPFPFLSLRAFVSLLVVDMDRTWATSPEPQSRA